jgi:pyruvate ferredoxin oxidoreductase gamma subunit
MIFMEKKQTEKKQATEKMIRVRWHGRGCQGSFTVARLLGMAAVEEGKFALAFPTFGPERRGAPVLGFTKIAENRIDDRSEVQGCDFVVVLDESLVDEKTFAGLEPDGSVIINTVNPEKYKKLLPHGQLVAIDATEIALRQLGIPITNTIMFGALVAQSGLVRLQTALCVLGKEMKSGLAGSNQAALLEAYNTVKGVSTRCAQA